MQKIRKKISRLKICMCGFCHTQTLLSGIQRLVYSGFPLKTCGNNSFWAVNSTCKNRPLRRALCVWRGFTDANLFPFPEALQAGSLRYITAKIAIKNLFLHNLAKSPLGRGQVQTRTEFESGVGAWRAACVLTPVQNAERGLNRPLRARCAFGGDLRRIPASIFGGGAGWKPAVHFFGAGWKSAVHFFSQLLRRATPQERREKRLNIIVPRYSSGLPFEEAPAARAGRPLLGGRSGHKSVRNVSNKEKKQKKIQSGFTLIELILVIVFLGIALITSMRAMSSSLTKSMDVEILMTATNLANEKLERILADKKSRGYAYVDQDNYSQEINVNETNGYNRYVTITVYSTYKEVNVKVTHSGVEDYELTTFLTNY